jgi:cytochrome c biogenesis protein
VTTVNTVAVTLRRAWRRLISMRTALILLFVLALAAVPGSLLPQRSLNPVKVNQYIAAHGAWGRLLNRIGAFEVFASVWFSAVYLLLFISLIGCLIPRIRVHAKAVRARPPRAPRNLNRLSQHTSWPSSGEPADLAAAARSVLRRWRVDVREAGDGVMELSAEKGYIRETGNLLFHISLLAALLLIAVGRLWHYEGSIVLEEDRGFCNSILNYDNFQAGRMAQNGRVAPFCVDKLNSFRATYRDDGSPAAFHADISYSPTVDDAAHRYDLQVNHPLRLEGDRLYLLGHGFAPKITVRMPNGTVQSGITAAFLPQDLYFTSEGAFTLQGMDCGTGEGTDVGLQGLFAPDGVERTTGVITSASPQPLHPVLAVLAYEGDSGGCSGQPHSVYSLDQNQIATGKFKQVGKANLTIGQTMKLPHGATVTFDGYVQWASLQVSHDPTQGYLLIAVIAMVTGLISSLAIRRRRVWMRLTPSGEPTSGGYQPIQVSAGGLSRSDSGNFTTEFSALIDRIQHVIPHHPAGAALAVAQTTTQ